METLNLLEDRRRDPRFPANKRSMVLLGDQQGEIFDVSRGGLGVRFDSRVLIPEARNLMIQMLDEDFYLSGTPVKIVPQQVLEEELLEGSDTARRCGVAFAELTLHQRFKLDYFLWLSTGHYI